MAGSDPRRLSREQATALYGGFYELAEAPVKVRDGNVHDGTPLVYNNVWACEATTGPDRLCIGAAGGPVDVLLDLAETMGGPYVVLYVLRVARTRNEPGRYQSRPLQLDELVALFERYRDFFERDARHDVWVASRHGGQLVYDEHDVIYAYGDLDAYTDVLTGRGFQATDHVGPTSAHSHCYHTQFDDAQTDLLNGDWGWIHTPLRPENER
jgi:hypothetical protein